MSIFFDSSALISMAVTCSLPLLRKLKKAYAGEFYITDTVYQETIGRALQSLRFRYEGHRLKELLDEGIIKIYPDKQLQNSMTELMNLINNTYFTEGQPLTIVQKGEMSAIIACIRENGDTVAVDERTARLLVESPEMLKPWLEAKFHTRLIINEDSADKWRTQISKKFLPLRSAEFALAAWQKRILGKDKDVFYGLLWALKFAGCAMTEQEINFYMKGAIEQHGP